MLLCLWSLTKTFSVLNEVRGQIKSLAKQVRACSYPRGGGKHVLLPELEAVHLLQDHSAVVFALEEVCAAEDGGDTLGLVPLHQHRGGRIVGLHTPETEQEMAERRRRWGGMKM